MDQFTSAARILADLQEEQSRGELWAWRISLYVHLVLPCRDNKDIPTLVDIGSGKYQSVGGPAAQQGNPPPTYGATAPA